MNAHPVFFIGGPCEGEVRHLDSKKFDYTMPVKGLAAPSPYGAEGLSETRMETATYDIIRVGDVGIGVYQGFSGDQFLEYLQMRFTANANLMGKIFDLLKKTYWALLRSSETSFEDQQTADEVLALLTKYYKRNP